MLESQFIKIFTDIPFNRTLGLKVDAIDNNQITMSFPMRDDLIGNFLHGILHGGVISSVLDMAGGAVAMVAVAEKHPDRSLQQLAEQLGKASTINIHVDYLRPGRGKHFFAKARILRSGTKISVTQMELFNEESVLIATGTGTYLIG